MKCIVVGTGAGGATAARELAAGGMDVLVLDAGRPFKPFTRRLGWVEPLRRAGILADERMISLLFPHMATKRSSDDLVLVRGITTGGCTTLSCGNMVRAQRGLAELGLDLSAEFDELERRLDVKPFPRERWRPVTERLFGAAARLGLQPVPTPKAMNPSRCAACGLCELGCATGARWDSRLFLGEAIAAGAIVRTGVAVDRVLVEAGRARGVVAGTERIMADAVVLAAGGIGTARILRASHLPVRDGLWADIVLTIGGRERGARHFSEPPMVWYARRPDYILSPYPDILSHFFHGPWRGVGPDDRVGVMVKLADAPTGMVSSAGDVDKALTPEDRERLSEGAEMATAILEEAGVSGPFTAGMLNAGHLGGTAPLTPESVPEMRPEGLPAGLWVADLSLAPASQGAPTILLTAALALRVARRVLR